MFSYCAQLIPICGAFTGHSVYRIKLIVLFLNHLLDLLEFFVSRVINRAY